MSISSTSIFFHFLDLLIIFYYQTSAPFSGRLPIPTSSSCFSLLGFLVLTFISASSSAFSSWLLSVMWFSFWQPVLGSFFLPILVYPSGGVESKRPLWNGSEGGMVLLCTSHAQLNPRSDRGWVGLCSLLLVVWVHPVLESTGTMAGLMAASRRGLKSWVGTWMPRPCPRPPVESHSWPPPPRRCSSTSRQVRVSLLWGPAPLWVLVHTALVPPRLFPSILCEVMWSNPAVKVTVLGFWFLCQVPRLCHGSLNFQNNERTALALLPSWVASQWAEIRFYSDRPAACCSSFLDVGQSFLWWVCYPLQLMVVQQPGWWFWCSHERMRAHPSALPSRTSASDAPLF